uniref:Uncharacterized protein n=1 Tax=Oncorhynchus mykiss TaxID=8022 RepID=A0A8C7QZS4_ONCMY
AALQTDVSVCAALTERARYRHSRPDRAVAQQAGAHRAVSTTGGTACGRSGAGWGALGCRFPFTKPSLTPLLHNLQEQSRFFISILTCDGSEAPRTRLYPLDIGLVVASHKPQLRRFHH